MSLACAVWTALTDQAALDCSGSNVCEDIQVMPGNHEAGLSLGNK